MKPLPFPKSLPDFQRLFPNDAACGAYMEKLRWPEGFTCPNCGTVGEPYRFENRPSVLRCRSCKRDTSLTAGTVMERTHTRSTLFVRCSVSARVRNRPPTTSCTPAIGSTLTMRLGLNRMSMEETLADTRIAKGEK